jgi:hypothetical protein
VTLKFNPPKPIGRYALYIERSYGDPHFKVFSSLGNLKNSFNYQVMSYSSETRANSKILENINGDWYVLYDVPVGTKNDELPWMKTSYRVYKHGYWHTVSTSDDPNAHKMVNSAPMTKDEYADWRVRVELDRRGIDA